MNKPIIEVKHIYKKYQIREKLPYYSLRDSIVNIFQPSRNKAFDKKNEFWALKDISFNVMPGEVIGIIGRNGAGKSTLLKILSQITHPTKGEIIMRGRVASLLEVGTGFHPELTGRENIYLNGAILGMKRIEIKKKFDEIVDFAEIEKFLDTPVKHYSSGMYMRLAFAVAAHLEPEILLVDEVLAVGDAEFQKKCLGKMQEVSKAGRTVLFVSHNLGIINKLCSKVFWIDKSSLKMLGKTKYVLEKYNKDTKIDINTKSAYMKFTTDKNKNFQLIGVKLMTNNGKLTNNFNCDSSIIVLLECKITNHIPGLYGYINILKKDGTVILEGDSYDGGINPLENLGKGISCIRIYIPPRTLGVGDYDIYLNFSSAFDIKNFNVESPGIIITFHLSDYFSKRGNKRNGFFSTLLPWELCE